MSRQPKIRITNKDKELLNKLNNRVNSKKRRIQQNFGISVPFETRNIKSFGTRNEFNSYVKQMQSFTNRNNQNYQYIKSEQGVTYTKKEYNQLMRNIKRVNRIKERENRKRAKNPFTDRGKQTGMTVKDRYDMGEKRGHEHGIKRNINSFRTHHEFNEYMKHFEETYHEGWLEEKQERYRQNYMKSLTTVFEDEAEHIRILVEQMPLKEFLNYYYSENFVSIQYVYSKEERDKKLKAIEMAFGWEW